MNNAIFKSYSNIENIELTKYIQQIHEYKYDDNTIRYRISEKVDGSNFSIWVYPNNTIKYAKRTNFINSDENFMNYKQAIRNDNLDIKAIAIRNELIKNNIITNNYVIVIYGELYGGFYHHPNVKKIIGSIKIQNRVSYAPDNYFYAFDILIIDNENHANYLNDNIVMNMCDLVQMSREIILFEGTFNECLKYPNDGISKVGTVIHHLPSIENNIMEGVVIKPINPLFFNNGQRVILKNKNNKFKERKIQTISNKQNFNNLTKEEEKYLNICQEYITESRLLSVISKIGKISDKDFGKVLGLFIQDLINDFNKEYKSDIDKINDIDKFNFKKIKQYLNKIIIEWLRPKFIQLINE